MTKIEKKVQKPSCRDMPLLPRTKHEVNVFARACLSVCLSARLLKNACMDLDEMLRVDRCRDMDELINFCFLRYRISAARRNFTARKSHV